MRRKKANPNKKVLIFIKNPIDPSAYFRIFQYLGEKNEVEFCCYTSDGIYQWYYNIGRNSRKISKFRKTLRKCIMAAYGIFHNTYQIHKYCNMEFDYVIVSRTVFPRIMPRYGVKLLKRLLKDKKVLWDFDDNIIENAEITRLETNLLYQYADHIIVSNDYLKTSLPKEISKKVQILCTTDKAYQDGIIQEFVNNREITYSEKIILVWVGTRDNLRYLVAILEYLEQAAKELFQLSEKKLILWCISNGKIPETFQWLEVHNIVWSREVATELITKAHIGLMPLQESEYTLGKAGFKAIQYISSGMPAIVSNVGYCKEVIEDRKNGYLINYENEWKSAILALSTNRERYIRFSYDARHLWEEKFNSNRNQQFWEEMIHLE